MRGSSQQGVHYSPVKSSVIMSDVQFYVIVNKPVYTSYTAVFCGRKFNQFTNFTVLCALYRWFES